MGFTRLLDRSISILLLVPALVLNAGVAALGSETAAATRPPVDLILIIDTSKSMIGAGGTPNIFAEVKQSAKELVEWAEPGDNVLLISYDERVNLRPTVAVYGEREKTHLKGQIDTLQAPGKWTYTAAAIRDAVDEARRLHETQEKTAAGSGRVKLAVLLTDGINDPPPYARAEPISLEEVARRVSDMPWYVWQIQLGQKRDDEVANAFGERHTYVPATKQELAKLLGGIVAQMERRLQRASLSIEPPRLQLGLVTAGKSVTRGIKVIAAPPGPTGRIRLRVDTVPSGGRLTLEPEEAQIEENGVATVQVHLAVEESAAAGQLAGVLIVEVVDGPLDLKQGAITWTAEVETPTRLLRVEPSSVEFGALSPGQQESRDIRLVADAAARGRVRLRVDAVPDGISVALDPQDITLATDGSGQALMTLTVGRNPSLGEQRGRLSLEVIGGSLALPQPSMDWSVTIEPAAVVLEPAEIDLANMAPGERVSREILVSTSADGRIRFVAEESTPGFIASTAPVDLPLEAGQTARVELTVEATNEASPGYASGRIIAEVIAGPLRPPAPAEWATRIPYSPLRIAATVGAALGFLILAGAVIWYLWRPRLQGTLRYWREGGSVQEIDLEPFGARVVRIGAGADCDIQLAGGPPLAATIRSVRIDGETLCSVTGEPGAEVKLAGREVTQLELYDRDEISIAGYTFAYRGEVQTRPRTPGAPR